MFLRSEQSDSLNQTDQNRNYKRKKENHVKKSGLTQRFHAYYDTSVAYRINHSILPMLKTLSPQHTALNLSSSTTTDQRSIRS